MRFAILAIIFLLTPFARIAAEELPENYYPARANGMGNAFVAVANDDDAVWSNPAGIARARKNRTRNWFVTKIPNIGGGANARGAAVYQSVTGGTASALADAVSTVGDYGESKPYWANLQLFPVAMYDYNRSWPGATGLFSSTTTKVVVEEETPDQARVSMISDVGPLFNLTWTNKSNRFSVGAQARYVKRYAYEDTVPIEDLKEKTAMQDRITADANDTSGIGLDLGMLYTVADFWFPTIGISALSLPTGCKENYLNPHTRKRATICGNLYQGDIANEDALSAIDPTDIRAGVAITPRISRGLSLRIALDAHHMAIASGSQSIGLPDIETQKLLHAGVELFLGNPLQIPTIAVRAGFNQGFLTSGFSVNLSFFSLDFSTYGVDVSSDSEPIEDRRYLTSMTLVF